jgi:hypothetical protein
VLAARPTQRRGLSRSDLVLWHKLPFATVQNYVRFLGYSGREMLAAQPHHIPKRGAAVAREVTDAAAS